MINDFFSELLFREPIIKDNIIKTDNQFEIESKKLKTKIPVTTPSFEIEFKRPLHPIRKYYYKRISNETTALFNELVNAFSSKNVLEENVFLYQKFYNVFSQNLNNIHDYIKNGYVKPEHYLSPEYNYYSDEAYIIYFLKANIHRHLIQVFLPFQKTYHLYYCNLLQSLLQSSRLFLKQGHG